MAHTLRLVEARLRSAFGEPQARAAVTFLGADRIEVLRFADPEAGVLRYATLGMSATPMRDPLAPAADPVRGPRAELVLTVRPGRADTDRVLRPLAVLAASPQVEGVVIAPGNSLDVGEPLWPGAPFSAVLVAEPGGLVEDLYLGEDLAPDLGADPRPDPGLDLGADSGPDPGPGAAPILGSVVGPGPYPGPVPRGPGTVEPVRFLPLLPMTSDEAAWKRVHGAAALRERWLRHGTDLRDPLRAEVPLTD